VPGIDVAEIEFYIQYTEPHIQADDRDEGKNRRTSVKMNRYTHAASAYGKFITTRWNSGL